MKRFVTAAAVAGSVLLHPGGLPAAMSAHPAGPRLGLQNVSQLHAAWSFPDAVRAVASKDRVFVSLRAGRGLAVLDARDGKQLHTFTNHQLGVAPRDSVTPLVYAGSKLIIASSLWTAALDSESGHILWRWPGGATDATVAGNVIYTGQGCQTGCGTPASVALHLSTGRILWRHSGNFGGPPVLLAGKLYQNWGEGHGFGVTRVYEPATGKLLETLPLDAQWTGNEHGSYAQVLEQSTSVAGSSWLGRIASKGHVMWRVPLGRILTLPAPLYAGHRLYVSSNRYHPGVLAVDARSGNILWGASIGPVSNLAVAGRFLFVTEENAPRLDILDAASGRLLRRLTLSQRSFPPNQLLTTGDTLYVYSFGITAFRPIGSAP